MPDGDLTLTTADGPMDVFEVTPEAPPRAAIIVIQEAFGVNPHIRDVTGRFAAAGYHAVAPALFHRAGGGTAPYDDFEKVIPLFKGLTDDGIMMDVDTTIEHLHRAGFTDDTIGIVGFCMGGRVTFLTATKRRLGAAVGFYGGGIVKDGFGGAFPALIGGAADLHTPWLGLFGDLDKGIPVEDVELLRSTLDEVAPAEHEIVRYAAAEHGFHCDRRPAYHEASAKDAWGRTLAWFDQHLG